MSQPDGTTAERSVRVDGSEVVASGYGEITDAVADAVERGCRRDFGGSIDVHVSADRLTMYITHGPVDIDELVAKVGSLLGG